MIILGRRDMIEEVTANPDKYSVVAICEYGELNAVEAILDKSDCLVLDFMDHTWEERASSPKMEHVEQVLEWAKTRGPENMLVSCAAGVSRSSAMAFLIECQRTSPEEAVKLWKLGHHHPNELILHFGVQILGDHLIPTIKEYIQADAKQQGLPVDYITKFFK